MTPNCQPVQFPLPAVTDVVLFPGAFRTSLGCMLASGTIHQIHVVANRVVTVEVYDGINPTTAVPAQSTNRRRFEVDVTGIDAVYGGNGGSKNFECFGTAITGGVTFLTDLKPVTKLYFPANSGPQDKIQVICPFGMILKVVGATAFVANETLSVQYVPKCMGSYRVRLAERQQELASS